LCQDKEGAKILKLRDVEAAEQIPLDVLLQEEEQSTPSAPGAEPPCLMWAWTGSTLERELDAAFERFREKFGSDPVAIYVNMMDAERLPMKMKEIAAERGLTVRAAVNILPGKFELTQQAV
jgi:hypothetical protein